jgi:hypothetical protein
MTLAAILTSLVRLSAASMRRRNAQGHARNTWRRLLSPSASAAANASAARSTGFSVKRATATAKA